jgi:drug/metabolite transporter (DMT)-like permease
MHAAALPLSVTLVVLAAAVTHATWNAIAHGIKDQLLAFGLIGAGGILVAIPLVIVSPFPLSACWPYLLASIVIHVFYNLLLMRSYRHGEFGQVYPLARGTSPLVVTVLAAVFAAERPSAAQVAGVLVVSCGLPLLVLAGRTRRRAAAGGGSGAAVLWAQTRGDLAPIAALRETSVIFGAVIGTVVFREPFGRWRIAATLLVVIGVLLLNVS